MAKSVAIENPIINTPFAEPTRHFRFDDDGITDEIVDGRRRSEYFMPIPAAKKKAGGGQAELVFDEWTQDRIEENKFINDIRRAVELWRSRGRPSATGVSRRLLEYWSDPSRERPLFFCQVEALETAIFLAEAAPKEQGGSYFLNELRRFNDDANPGILRIAHKMTTGTGKTVVMAMLIAWQTLNKAANPHDGRYSDSFLIVCPGITIRDRLRVVLPSDPGPGAGGPGGEGSSGRPPWEGVDLLRTTGSAAERRLHRPSLADCLGAGAEDRSGAFGYRGSLPEGEPAPRTGPLQPAPRGQAGAGHRSVDDRSGFQARCTPVGRPGRRTA